MNNNNNTKKVIYRLLRENFIIYTPILRTPNSFTLFLSNLNLFCEFRIQKTNDTELIYMLYIFSYKFHTQNILSVEKKSRIAAYTYSYLSFFVFRIKFVRFLATVQPNIINISLVIFQKTCNASAGEIVSLLFGHLKNQHNNTTQLFHIGTVRQCFLRENIHNIYSRDNTRWLIILFFLSDHIIFSLKVFTVNCFEKELI